MESGNLINENWGGVWYIKIFSITRVKIVDRDFLLLAQESDQGLMENHIHVPVLKTGLRSVIYILLPNLHSDWPH